MNRYLIIIILLTGLYSSCISYSSNKIYGYDEVDVRPLFGDSVHDETMFWMSKVEYPYPYEHRIDSIIFIEPIDEAVCVEFIVTKKGHTKKLEVYDEMTQDPLYKQEALRVVKLMNRWKPAYKEGKAVDAYHSVCIHWHNVDYDSYVLEPNN